MNQLKKIIRELKSPAQHKDAGPEPFDMVAFVYKWKDDQAKLHAAFSQAGEELMNGNYFEN